MTLGLSRRRRLLLAVLLILVWLLTDLSSWQPSLLPSPASAPEASAAAAASARLAAMIAAAPAAVIPEELVPLTEGQRLWLPELEYDFARTAIVTMVAGDIAARGAIVLLQSLRDVGTRVPEVIVALFRGGIGSPDCENQLNPGREDVDCSGPYTLETEVASAAYIATLRRLGARVELFDPIPATAATMDLAGGVTGGRTFWGMALSKLRVFNLTRYKKIMWMDSDTMAMRNVDHLMTHPPFTASYTTDCCNDNGPAVLSGGLWVFEPSADLGRKIWTMLNIGMPDFDPETLAPIFDADGQLRRAGWPWGDQQVMHWLVGQFNTSRPYMWPTAMENLYGTVPGFRDLPPYNNMSQEDYEANTLEPYERTPQVVGWAGPPAVQPREAILRVGSFGFEAPAWRILNHTYDHFVGNCECQPQRELPLLTDYTTLHFSCLHYVEKPGVYSSEFAFLDAVLHNSHLCTRRYLHVWFDAFTRAHGRLPPPLWNGTSREIPTVEDATHEARVVLRQEELRNIEAAEDAAAALQAAEEAAAAAGGAPAGAGPAGEGGRRRLVASQYTMRRRCERRGGGRAHRAGSVTGRSRRSK